MNEAIRTALIILAILAIPIIGLVWSFLDAFKVWRIHDNQ